MNTNSGQVIADFVASFQTKDIERLALFLHSEVEFEAYGERPILGRERLLAMWSNVFANYERVEFSTLHQAVNDDIVIEEQIHALALPNRHLAPIKNVAVYRVLDGLITEWRDYTNPEYSLTLL